VLYLDDYPAIVFMVKATLEAKGYRVTGFEDAAQAMAWMAEHAAEVDLLVTDFNMPGRSGLDVAREALALRPGLPVIVASGYVTDELREGADCIGVARLFDKPRGIEGLCEMIGELLRPAPTLTE
jgi:two-component system, cell cycle sensor histidine kinase and response regulator CckA